MLTIDVEDNELSEFKKRRIAECILPPMLSDNREQPIGPESLNQLGSALMKFGESIDRSNAVRSLELSRLQEKDEEKGNRVKSVMDSFTHKMLLNAMSVDGERPAADLTDDFKRFFNAKTEGAAGLETLNQLKTAGFMNSTVSKGAVNNMYHGNLVSLINTVVSGFCPFTFSKAKIMSESQQKSFMIMHQQDSFGGSKSAEDIEKSMKQNIIMPNNYHDMMGMLNREQAMMVKWLGCESELTVEHSDFIAELEKSECTIEAKTESDKDYCTKIMYGSALTEQVFWRQCYESAERELVAKPNFKRITDMVEIGQFNCDLPAQFKRVEKRSIKEVAGNNDDTLNAEIKRLKAEINKKKNNNNNSNQVDPRVFNDDQYKEFKLRRNEDYKKVFCSSRKHEILPLLSENIDKMCQKWNIQGYYFGDCKKVGSHVPASEYTEKNKKEFSEWMAQCRAGSRSN